MLKAFLAVGEDDNGEDLTQFVVAESLEEATAIMAAKWGERCPPDFMLYEVPTTGIGRGRAIEWEELLGDRVKNDAI
jgi:hypothetical protein